MARFITVEVGCDWPDCGTRAPEGDGTIVEKTMTIDGKQGRAFLLCEPKHREAFEDVVLPLMQAGVKVEAPARRTTSSTGSPQPAPPVDLNHPDTNICKAETAGVVCGRPIRKRTGMAQHVIRTHGFESLDAYEAQYGPLTS